MSGYPTTGRSGKAAMVLGVACIVAGFALRVVVINRVANEAPPQFWAQSQSGNGLLMLLAWLLVVAGLVLTVVGVIRYAQSGSGQAMYVQSPAHSTSFAVPAAVPERPAEAAPAKAPPAFCSSCGAGVVGAGRFCASCGEPIAR